jgi:S1-C subfamily serine protease
MLKLLPIVLAAIAIGGGVTPRLAHTQEGNSQEANASAERARALEEARRELEQARRDLEAVARRVAELSGGPVRFGARPFSAQRSMLGLNIATAPDSSGVRVLGVSPGGPGAEAGVETGEVITAIDSVELAGDDAAARLIEHLADVAPGQAVALRVLRDGVAREVTVTAREADWNTWVFAGPGGNRMVLPHLPDLPNGENFNAWVGPFQRFFGAPWNDLELVTLTPELGSYFGATEGLLVVHAPDDAAIGLQDGDVVLDIGGRKPTSPEHALRILASFAPDETLRMTIMRRQRRETVEYTIPGVGQPG